MAPNGTCNIRLVVNPQKSGKISQTLKVTGKSKKGVESSIYNDITVYATLAKSFILNKSKLDNPVFDKFTIPIIIHNFDNYNKFNNLFFVVDDGLVKLSYNDSDSNYSYLHTELDKPIKNIHVNGNNIYLVFENSIAISQDSGKSWVISDDFTSAHDVYQIKGTIFATVKSKSGGKYELNTVTIENNNAKLTKVSSLDEEALSIYGYDDTICIAGTNGIHISKDFGASWTTYLNRTKVLSIYANNDNLYAGTEHGLFIMDNNNGQQLLSTLSKSKIKTIYAQNKMIFVAAEEKDNSIIYTSSDNAATWDKLDLDNKSAMVFFPNALPDVNKLYGDMLANAMTNVIPPNYYYDILGINERSNCDAIGAAYRKLSKKTHPDINKASGAAEAFQMLNKAKDELYKKHKCS